MPNFDIEYPVNFDKKSKPGCSPTRTMKNKTKNSNASAVWLTVIGVRLKTKQVYLRYDTK